MNRWWGRALTALLTVTALGCGAGGQETRTIELAHMSPEQAQLLVEPYVDSRGASIRRTDRPAALTITERAGRLDQIEELLRRYDLPSPKVRLRFQIIEADGFTNSDSAIADVEAALRELFRFRGYRLAAETTLSGEAGQPMMQRLILPSSRPPGDVPVQLSVDVIRVVSVEGRKAVELRVHLNVGNSEALVTGITVPHGQTVVIGNSRPTQNLGTLILVVRPEIE